MFYLFVSQALWWNTMLMGSCLICKGTKMISTIWRQRNTPQQSYYRTKRQSTVCDNNRDISLLSPTDGKIFVYVMYYWTDYLHVLNSGCCQITSAASERALHEAGSTNKNFYSSSATGELPRVTEKPSHNRRWSNKGFDAGKSRQRWTTLTWS